MQLSRQRTGIHGFEVNLFKLGLAESNLCTNRCSTNCITYCKAISICNPCAVSITSRTIALHPFKLMTVCLHTKDDDKFTQINAKKCVIEKTIIKYAITELDFWFIFLRICNSYVITHKKSVSTRPVSPLLGLFSDAYPAIRDPCF